MRLFITLDALGCGVGFSPRMSEFDPIQPFSSIGCRTRAYPEDQDAPLPPAVREFLDTNYDGMFPDNAYDALDFLQSNFSNLTYRVARRKLIFRLQGMGFTNGRMAVLFNRSERTVERWVADMRQAMVDYYTTQEVRDLHAERMAELDAMEERINQTCYNQREIHLPVLMMAMQTKLKVQAMRNTILTQAGYYRVFDLSKRVNPEQDEAIRDNANFIRDMELLAIGGDPVAEFYGDGDGG